MATKVEIMRSIASSRCGESRYSVGSSALMRRSSRVWNIACRECGERNRQPTLRSEFQGAHRCCISGCPGSFWISGDLGVSRSYLSRRLGDFHHQVHNRMDEPAVFPIAGDGGQVGSHLDPVRFHAELGVGAADEVVEGGLVALRGLRDGVHFLRAE